MRPNIYTYHDYRKFLKDWFQFLKEKNKGFSMRSLATDAGLSVAYLPFVLSGTRNLSNKSLEKLSPFLNLSRGDLKYLTLMCVLSDSDSQVKRTQALEQLQKMKLKHQQNPEELEAFRYLTHWYYVAVRELAELDDFEPDPKWVAKKLRNQVSVKEANEALQFLISNGYLVLDPKGKARVTEKELIAKGGMYRVLLNHFHEEILEQGRVALSSVSNEERHVIGYTFAFSDEQLPEIKRILDSTIGLLRACSNNSPRKDRLYHTTLYTFPLSDKVKEKGSRKK